MTKKHYEAIAKALKTHKPHENWLNKHTQYELMVCDLAAYFAQDNPRFDKYKFYEACGIEKS
jgi:hypothetical protein